MSALAAGVLALALVAVPGAGAAADRLRPARQVGGDGAARAVAPARGADPMSGAAGYDLLAACLRSGLPVGTAAAAVAPTSPEPLGGALDSAASLLALGADPEVAWARAAADPETEVLARIARRSARSGASLAAAVAELRPSGGWPSRTAAVAAAERAGVLVSGPLGLCFLPAFLCLGIVPVVVGLASRVMGEGLL